MLLAILSGYDWFTRLALEPQQLFVLLMLMLMLWVIMLCLLLQEGQDYLAAMAAAANFAWVNRSSMTFLVRQAFAKQFGADPDDLDMHVVYDVSHNIAKVGCRL
jgi:hypothetical protein